MRKSSVCHLLLVACCLLLWVACPKRPKPEAWIPRHANWQDGEVSTYNVMKGDTVAGQSVFTIRSAIGQARGPAPTGNRVWEITGVNSSSAQGLHDSVTATLSFDDLKSLGSFQIRSVASRLDTVISRYASGTVQIRASGGQAQTLVVPVNAFDNSILVAAIRSLDLKPGAHYLLTSVASFGPWTKPADVQVLADDTVNVPAGRFACRKVSLEIAGWPMHLWYEREAPYRYVKFENTVNNSSAVLTDYTKQ
jgi:hypothetical protein